MNNKLRRVLSVICVAVVSSTATLFACMMIARQDDLEPYLIAREIIRRQYFFSNEKEQLDQRLTEGAMLGLAYALDDKYADYYTEEEYAELMTSQAGEYVGVGITITDAGSKGFEITTVYEGSPMDRAGAAVGDFLRRVNGRDLQGLTMDEVLAFFHQDDTADELGLQRPDGTEYTVTVTRETVSVPYTEGYELTTDIYCLSIRSFLGKAAEECEAVVDYCIEKGYRGLVVDLRNNPGGDLNIVLAVADLFLEKGELITTLESREGADAEYRAKSAAKWTRPTVVLVNKDSASASELLSGALQDHGRAVIMGTTTYGKGIVQSTFHIGGGYGYLKLTTEAYYTPNHICIQGTGITPDISVENDPSSSERDLQLERAAEYLTEQIAKEK